MPFLSATLHFDEQTVSLDVTVQNVPILFGLWSYEVRLGKKILHPAGEWTQVCSHREKQCDYQEIDLSLEYDYRLQRSVLLNHKDKVMLLSDTVLYDGDDPGKPQAICYESLLHFSQKLKCSFSEVQTELLFKPAFRVFPLALQEQKVQQDANFLFPGENGTIVLHQQTQGVSMFSPLFFDLDSARLGKQGLWRHLTIGENLQRVPDDKAVGYRVQLGKEQFLIYRSLTPAANRTVLGHNLIDDFCFARFSPEDGAEPLIEVVSVDT